MSHTFYKIIPNPLVSLTNEKVAELNRWLNIMTHGDVTWAEARVELANAESMKAHISKQDPSLEEFIIIVPIPSCV